MAQKTPQTPKPAPRPGEWEPYKGADGKQTQDDPTTW